MKKIYNILLLTLTLGLASCVGEVDDIFTESPTNRAAETLVADWEVLMSAPNGWRLEMKADPDDEFEYGAYNLFLKFNADSTVTVASELAKSDSIITSHFKLYQSQGINLSFDEYNAFVHYFSNPIAGLNMGATPGKGLKGDQEFLIVKATKEEVILKGKKSGVNMRMTPVEVGRTWKEEIDSINTINKFVQRFDDYKIIFKDTKDTVRLSRTYHSFAYTDKNGDRTIIPFVITKKGIEFLKTQNIAGHDITGFEYKQGVKTFNSFDDVNTTITIVVPTPAEAFERTAWYFARSAMSGTLANFYAYPADWAPTVGYPVKYTAMYIDYDADNECDQAVLYIQCDQYGGYIYYQYTLIDDNTVKLELYGTQEGDERLPYKAKSNGDVFYNNFGFSYFAQALNGTYTLTPDDELSPQKLLFTNQNNAKIYFTLTKEEVEDPNDK